MHVFALKNHFWNAQQARQLPGFHKKFAALFGLNFCSSEFPLSAIANLFEFRSQQKQLMLLSYKICPLLPNESFEIRVKNNNDNNNLFIYSL